MARVLLAPRAALGRLQGGEPAEGVALGRARDHPVVVGGAGGLGAAVAGRVAVAALAGDDVHDRDDGGTYDAETRIERPRIQVTLATGIPRERCEKVNLGYLAPCDVDVSQWQGREEEGVLVVPKAGEMLYRVR